ncbi:MAG: type II toxin-antitoxin system prevent-host-death family antitoxin [Anaerolineae bacterium]
MEPAKVSSTDLRLKTRDLMERVKYKGETLIIENFHRPVAVLISYEDYLQFQQLLTGPRDAQPEPDQADHKTLLS